MKKNIITSFLISFFYVLLGTIVVVVSFPEYQILGFNHEHPLWLPLVIITLPVNILLFGLVMVEFSIFYIKKTLKINKVKYLGVCNSQ